MWLCKPKYPFSITTKFDNYSSGSHVGILSFPLRTARFISFSHSAHSKDLGVPSFVIMWLSAVDWNDIIIFKKSVFCVPRRINVEDYGLPLEIDCHILYPQWKKFDTAF